MQLLTKKRAGRQMLPALTLILISLGIGSTLFAQTTAATADPAPKGFLSIVFSGGVVGWLMILILLALSLTAAYLIFDQVMTIRRKDIMPDGLGESVRELLKAGQVEKARQACADQPCLLSFVLLHGISELEYGWTSVEKAIEDALAEQSARLLRKVEYLSVIGNIAPMIGLLGTVIGMITAFQQVAANEGNNAPALAEGIYQALVTTVGGLIVAIPAIGAFAVFRNRIDQFIAESAYVAQHIFSPLRRKAKSK